MTIELYAFKDEDGTIYTHAQTYSSIDYAFSKYTPILIFLITPHSAIIQFNTSVLINE